jgi:hypothetical protein
MSPPRVSQAAAAIAAALLVPLALAGCYGSEENRPADPEGRGAGAYRATPGAATAKTGDPLALPADDEERTRLQDYRAPDQPAGEPQQPGATGETGEAAPPREPERDLAAELRERVGDPSACLNALVDLPAEVSISIEATVTTTGIVTRSYARGAGVPDDALECVRRRLDTARLRAPIPNAPRNITTTLTLRRQPPPSGTQ